MISRLESCRLAGFLVMGSLLLNPDSGLGRDAPTTKEQDHWAFQPVRRPALPAVRDASWVRTPIDAFVLARLNAAGMQPAPEADRRTLLRRVYLDLIGLPPNLREQRAFLEDTSPLAFAKVVDDLLSRPQYGERWGRHWLDVVRYAESNGYERDGPKPSAWRYRDYVINSFNQDKPYDRFVTEQLAGDEVPDASAESHIGATFLRLGTWDDEPADPMVDRYDQLDDVLGTTATAFLGLTLRCARCHDHKFEPFAQADYYRMLAVFEPLKRPQNGRADLDRPVGTAVEVAAFQAAEAETARLKKQIDGLKKGVEERHLVKASKADIKSKQSGLPAEVLAAFLADPAKRTGAQKEQVKKHAALFEQEVRAAATPEELKQWEDWDKHINSINATRPQSLPTAYIWYEEGTKAPVTHVLRRGDPQKPLDEVGPGLPGILIRQPVPPPQTGARSTGRRLWLTRWMTSPSNPLVARVMVNRVWQHHFGEGLVASANDFGVMGDKPSDPALLDWLASELVDNGWRLKPLHRLMVLSNAYQMSSKSGMDREQSRGKLAGRWRQRRLEAEAVRDSVLAVSGQLNPQMAGPSFYPSLPRAVLEGQSRPGENWGKSDARQTARRSTYIFVKRVLAVPELELLDAPDTTFSCEQRPVSTTGPQALTFLNGDFMRQQAGHFADRLQREVGNEPRSQVERAFELALCRIPRAQEVQLALEFLAVQQRQIEDNARKAKKASGDARRQALAAFCLVLLNTNEFAYWN